MQTQTETPRKLAGEELLPWRCASSLTRCSLYWIPVNLGAIPKSQKDWLLEFFRLLSDNLQKDSKLRAEMFMQMKVIQPPGELWDTFSESMFETSPVPGLGRRPGASDPQVVTKQLADEFAKGKKEYRPSDYMDDSCYWFMNKNDSRIRSLFLGSGGLTTMFVTPSPDGIPSPPALPASVDPQSVIIPKFIRDNPMMKLMLADFRFDNPTAMPAFLRDHPAMKQAVSMFRPEQMPQSMASLSSDFGSRSKELFAFNMKRNLKFQALPFIIPLLGTQDFFAQSEEAVKSWFTFVDVYINESPADLGIVMAARDNLKPVIASIISTMRQAGYRYWEG
jgi:hypothetical protein